MSGERAGVAEVLLPTLIALVCAAAGFGGLETGTSRWHPGDSFPTVSQRFFGFFCLSVTPYLSFHLYPLSPLPVIVSLSAVLSSQRLLHLSARVIETCVPSLSAKRLADCLHFHAEGCDASVAALIVIDWDPSKPSPLWEASTACLPGPDPLRSCPFFAPENGNVCCMLCPR